MKKLFVIISSMILALAVLAGCSRGVSKEQYQKLQDELATARIQNEALNEELEGLQNRLDGMNPLIVWSWGRGLAAQSASGLDYEKEQNYRPFMAEELDGDKILFANANHWVSIIDKSSGELIWQFGTPNESGSGDKLNAPTAAHRFPKGAEAKSDRIIIADYGNHRAIIVNYDTKEIEWEYALPSNRYVLDAIWGGSDLIYISDGIDQVIRVRISDKSVVAKYHVVEPYYLQNLGGELLIGTEGATSQVRHVSIPSGKLIWSYGREPLGNDRLQRWYYGVAYNQLLAPHRALMVGGGVNRHYVIADATQGRVFAVDIKGKTMWEIGGKNLGDNPDYRNRVPSQDNFPLVQPNYVSFTKAGNLLITDTFGGRVIEIAAPYPPKERYEAELFHNYITTDSWVDSEIAEVIFYSKNNIQVFNEHNSNSLEWRLLGSPDLENDNWVEIQLATTLAPEESDFVLVNACFRFIKAQARSKTPKASAVLQLFITCTRY